MAHNLCRWLDVIGHGRDAAEDAGPLPDPAPVAAGAGGPPQEPTRRPVITNSTFIRRIFTMPGRLSRSGRRYVLHAPRNWTWALQIEALLARLRVLPVPA